MEFLLGLHSGWRYVVLLAGVVTFVMGLLALRAGAVGDRSLLALRLFAVAVDVQFLAGVALLFVRGFYPQLMGHLILMIAAVALVHLLSMTLKKRPPERRTPALLLTGTGIALLLMVAGIMAIGRPVL